MTLILTPGSTSLDQLYAIWHDGQAAKLTPDAAPAIEAAAALVAKAASGEEAIYGAAEAIDVGTTFARVDIVDKAVDVLLEGGVILHGHLDFYIFLSSFDVDRLFDQVLLPLI